MPKPSVYLESSAVSYYIARPSRDVIVLAHQHVTREWWEECLPALEVFVSPLVIEEASQGDPDAAKRRLDVLAVFAVLEITQEAELLANQYLAEVPPLKDSPRDALHVAIASSSGMDYLATWNCAHIASGRVRKAIESVNDSRSIATPTICTPEELMEFRS
jgi:predicted nucleic acid-binding protein